MRRRKEHLSKNKQLRLAEENFALLLKKFSNLANLALQVEKENEQLKRQVSKLNEELFSNTKNAALIRELLTKAINIDFHRASSTRETYRCQVDFDGQFMGMLHSRSEQEFVADDVAERIRREIVTSKFVNTVNNNRRRELDEEMKRSSQQWVL